MEKCEEKWKMTLSIDVQFNGSVINLVDLAMKRVMILLSNGS
jgi:hypothetical protein